MDAAGVSMTIRPLGVRARLALRRLSVVAVAMLAFAGASAHVGSPDAFFVGRAGSYDVRIVVRPPEVIPGRAEVIVRVAQQDVREVRVRPVYWRTGVSGAPVEDALHRIAGSDAIFTGTLWLMERGANSAYVTVDGQRGGGTVRVPLDAIATGSIPMPTATRWLLVVLGVGLFVGLLSIVRAAIGESVVPPSEKPSATHVRRARRAFMAGIPVLSLALLGGWRWWVAEDRAAAEAAHRPLRVRSTLRLQDAVPIYTLTVNDPLWSDPDVGGAIMPDHGKMMHLFLVGDSAFAHLHPTMRDSVRFETALPSLPPGRYRVFGDVVHESGYARTLIAALDISSREQLAASTKAGAVSSTAASALDADDAWLAGAMPSDAASSVRLSNGAMVRWLGAGNEIRERSDARLRFAVTNADGQPATMEPYLGMAAHAVVMRDSGDVFVHLHPMGTTSNAAQQSFVLRDRGDTSANGRLRLRDTASATHDAMAHGATSSDVSANAASTVEFPYEFPKAGRYRVWVQLRLAGRVETAPFTVVVR
jgi:hypothetical protein